MTGRYGTGIIVKAYSPDWARQFRLVAAALAHALVDVPIVSIEHVGSTAVPGLPAKPILDIDVVVPREVVDTATAALERAGYVHLGDLGLTDREAFTAPDERPARNVYVCVTGTLHLRNHLAVRAALLENPALKDRYGAVKQQLADRPGMDLRHYIAGKSTVLQHILAVSDLTAAEKEQIHELNTRE